MDPAFLYTANACYVVVTWALRFRQSIENV
jgi:hypothetical protein